MVSRRFVRTVSASALALGSAIAGQAYAQAVPGVTREEIERGVVEGVLEERAQPLAIDTDFERAPCPLAAPEFADIRFTVNTVTFSGTEAIPGEDLTEAYRPFVGQEHPVAIICEIRDRAASTLRARGYLAAVQVPPQEIAGGNVTLDVLLARMTRVQVRGEAGPSEALLARYIAKLTDQPVFNINEAERYLLLARDIPGLDVRLSLRPTDGAPGEVIGEFSVLRTPVYADVSVQNLGSGSVGRWGALGRVTLNGLTGMGDSTTASLYSTLQFEEQQVATFGHQFRVGSEGLTLGGTFTYAWTNPDIGIDIHSETLSAGAYASYPFLRTQGENIFGTVGFDYIDQDVDFAGVALTQDNLRVVYARVAYNAIDRESIVGRNGYSIAEPRWALAGSIEVRQGLDVFGASEGCGPGLIRCLQPGFVPPSRAEGDPTAFVLRAQGSFEFRPVPLVTFAFEPRLQYSPDALLSYEEFSGGNYTIGRGFDPGVLIGDSGVGFRTEFRYGRSQPTRQDDSTFQPYAFLDAAWTWNEDSAFDGIDPQELYSAGVGVRANVMNTARIDAMLAVPLNEPGFVQDRDVRFLLTASFQLAPWTLGR